MRGQGLVRLIFRSQCLRGDSAAAAERAAGVVRTRLSSLALTLTVCLPLLGGLLAAIDRLAWAAAPLTSMPKDEEDPALWLRSPGRDIGPADVAPTPTNPAGAAADQSLPACDGLTALRTGTITLDEKGLDAPCILMSAGDLLTWVNATTVRIVIQTADDHFATDDVSTTFHTVEVPAEGQAIVRVIHAGRLEYTVQEHPEMSGTILVLGRGAA